MYQECQQADIAVKRLGDLMDVPSQPYSSVSSICSNKHTTSSTEYNLYRG